jgi:tetratricopeptide (TPR) repeat protein
MAQNFRSLVISILALWEDLSQKEIGVAASLREKRVSRILKQSEIKDADSQRLLAAVKGSPAKVLNVTGCLEGLEAIEQATDFTAEEMADVEAEVQSTARLIREGLMEALRRCGPAVARSPQSGPAESPEAGELKRWLLCAAACEQSVREASRNLDSAAAWARQAREMAEQARGPEGARNRLRGYAAAHEANILRAAGELRAAESVLEEAKRLWQSGCDPYGVLDPGRLLHFEAALRRAERRFDEALALLDEAETVSYPERALVSRGFTLEVMGQYERAIETLLQAVPRVDRQADPRLWNILRLNLAALLCHVGNYGEAAALVEVIRPLVADLGDEIDLVRLLWLEGRVAAGQGRSAEARRLLAQARSDFAARGMAYDVALALLEEAVLLLDEGRTAEVKALAEELTAVFEDKGVHREALAALRLFHEAVEREEATAELARRVLRFLFRARYDPELRFEAPDR